jgi:hypothetical protein
LSIAEQQPFTPVLDRIKLGKVVLAALIAALLAGLIPLTQVRLYVVS